MPAPGDPTPPSITSEPDVAAPGRSAVGTWLRALRWKQWVKNVLLFLPLLFSHQWSNLELVCRAILGFAAFCAGASAIYLINDLQDMQADREHPKKRFRPLAAGLIQPGSCWVASIVLLVGGGALALYLSHGFFAMYVVYGVAATAYSMGLKRVTLLDALMLAGFYTLRIFAGSLATSTPVSKWLLLFSLFFFLGLAFQKRLAELRAWQNAEEPLRRRGYVKADLEHLNSMGTSASYLAVLVLALYIQSPDVVTHYASPDVLFWILPCLLYWVSRLWLLAGRDEVTEDAISFAVRDQVSYVVAAIVAAIVILARPI